MARDTLENPTGAHGSRRAPTQAEKELGLIYIYILKTRPSSPITTALQCRASGAGRGRVSSDRARAARLVFASRFSVSAAISVFPDADPFRCSERARRAWFVQTDFCPTGLTDPPRLASRTLCATLLRTRLSIRLLCAALLRTRPPAPRADMYSRRPALRERKIRMPPFSALVRAPAPAPPPNLDAIRGTSATPAGNLDAIRDPSAPPA